MRTNAGADWQAGVMADTANTGNTPGQYAPANYIALTADTLAEDEDNWRFAAQVAEPRHIHAS